MLWNNCKLDLVEEITLHLCFRVIMYAQVNGNKVRLKGEKF